MFDLKSPFKPIEPQRAAIDKLVAGIRARQKHQVLFGVTGSGKTFTAANVIAQTKLPTLVISHNKTLANQLYQELKEFFPTSAVHYFVSYYDYYQPEAYMPGTDTYIEKDAKINDEIEQLRQATTTDLLSRDDVIVVASVSCIYSIGDPEEYEGMSMELAVGQHISRERMLQQLVELQYHRNEYDPLHGEFRAHGNQIEIFLPYGTEKMIVTLERGTVEKLERMPLGFKDRGAENGRREVRDVRIFPAKLFVTPQDKLKRGIATIKGELKERLAYFKKRDELVEMQRLASRTAQDIAMMEELGYCSGIENYSRHLTGKAPGEPPFTLVDFFSYKFGQKWLCVIDESHMTVPQIRGMHAGDRSRKQTLIEYGFRLPSALDNRPLTFAEFAKRTPQTLYLSATPALFERDQAGEQNIAEQFIRPTGITEPRIIVRKTERQIPDLLKEIQDAIDRKEKTLVLTLTKRMAEDLTEFLLQKNVKTHWIHSEIKTLERPEILTDLRAGKVDVLVGINLLREGLDLPEVSLIAILDADKEGFLRNETSLLQIIGRAARHAQGRVILYADRRTKSIEAVIAETERKRAVQETYNKIHHVTPKSIVKAIPVSEKPDEVEQYIASLQTHEGHVEKTREIRHTGGSPTKEIIKALTKEMKQAAKEWDFEKAAKIKIYIEKLTGNPEIKKD